MKTHRKPAELRTALRMCRGRGETIAFVPTMGFLHRGHAALMREARARADVVVVSVFVNPTQFGPGEDLAAYPRDLDRDRKLCEAEGVSHLFVPEVATIYPPGFCTSVRVVGLSEGLCGASRPGHFDGVATVVTKLFNMVQPDLAVFGEKDFQQLTIIRQMVADLDVPLEIIGVPTVRESDGLALSSRNRYLTSDERQRAPALYRALQRAQVRRRGGELDATVLTTEISQALAAAGFIVEYVQFVDFATLEPMDTLDRPARLAVAARLGRTRLIDNVAVDPTAPGADEGDGGGHAV